MTKGSTKRKAHRAMTVCDLCGKRFTTEGLNSHVQEIYNKNKIIAFICEVCAKVDYVDNMTLHGIDICGKKKQEVAKKKQAAKKKKN